MTGLATIEFKGEQYLAFQTEGNASQFVKPFAQKVCIGTGYDIGYSRDEWKLPGAIGIDLADNKDEFHADNLPEEKVDYIFSSHCLEHVPNWSLTLQYWSEHIRPGGIIVLYLPDFSQHYWRPWHNRKHCHVLTPEIVKAFFDDHSRTEKLFVSQVDLNNSFTVMVQL